MAHMRRPQCCLSGFCSVSKVTMVREVVRAGRTTINYNSVLSYTGYTVTARLTPHALRPCESFRASSSHISPRNIFHRRKQDGTTTMTMARASARAQTEAHGILSRRRGLSQGSRIVNGSPRRGWRETITLDPTLGTMIDAPAFVGSCKSMEIRGG